jgi:hypothetical protein
MGPTQASPSRITKSCLNVVTPSETAIDAGLRAGRAQNKGSSASILRRPSVPPCSHSGRQGVTAQIPVEIFRVLKRLDAELLPTVDRGRDTLGYAEVLALLREMEGDRVGKVRHRQ